VLFADPMAQDRPEHRIMGEATRGVPDDQEAHPGIPWRISDMRNKVIQTTSASTWPWCGTCGKDLLPLRTQIEALLKDE
jgi:uncharacterized protein with HEPN domain